VVQGVVGRGLGMDAATVETLSAWALAAGAASAAVRLGLIGHLAAQALLTALTARIAAVLAAPPPARMHAFAPLADIAMARHASRDSRLFAT
jgi:urease accessory protein